VTHSRTFRKRQRCKWALPGASPPTAASVCATLNQGGVNLDAENSDSWKPIIPSISTVCFTKGYVFGNVYTMSIVLIAVIINAVESIQTIVSPLHGIVGENPSVVAQSFINIFSFLVLLILTTIIHEALHIISVPKFWVKGNLQVVVTLNRGIIVNNVGVTMTMTRTIFTVGLPIFVLTFALFVVSLFTNNLFATSILQMSALLNLLISSFDLRTLFYLLRLPKNALVKDGNYILPQ
jgi:hypothetical protein